MSRVTYNGRNMTITVEGLEDVSDALGTLKKKTPAAAKVAINAAAREAKKLMIAKARARYALNAAGQRHLKDLKVKSATNANLTATLRISKMRNDLGYFQHAPTSTFTGISVLKNAPEYVRAHVLKSSPMRALSGTAGRSKGFLVEFNNNGGSNHIGMVQRAIGSSSSHTETRRGRPRWRNAAGNVEKLVTMGSPSASAMHGMVWPEAEPDVEEILLERLDAQVQKILARSRKA